MNKTKELRQRSKRTKRLVIAVTVAVVGGFGAATILPASAGSFCATQECIDNGGTVLPAPTSGKGASRSTVPLTGQGFTAEEAQQDLTAQCKLLGGDLKVGTQSQEADEEGTIFVSGECTY